MLIKNNNDYMAVLKIAYFAIASNHGKYKKI